MINTSTSMPIKIIIRAHPPCPQAFSQNFTNPQNTTNNRRISPTIVASLTMCPSSSLSFRWNNIDSSRSLPCYSQNRITKRCKKEVKICCHCCKKSVKKTRSSQRQAEKNGSLANMVESEPDWRFIFFKVNSSAPIASVAFW